MRMRRWAGWRDTSRPWRRRGVAGCAMYVYTEIGKSGEKKEG